MPVQPTPSTSPTPKEKALIAVFYPVMGDSDFYLAREIHEIPKSGDLMVAALEELVKGTPQTKQAMKVLPPGTEILAVEVKDGIAIVNFNRKVLEASVGSSLEALGITSIVNTLCEFPGVEKVSFLVEGTVDEETMDWWGHVGLYEQPFEPNWNAVMKPAIWVTSPLPGDKIENPVIIRGKAMVFEASLSGRIKDSSGKTLAQGNTMASKGAPERGDFQLELRFDSPTTEDGYLEVFTYSAKDGSEIIEAKIPIKFK